MTAYRRLHPNADLLFVGSTQGFEGRLVAARGFELASLPAFPFMRQGFVGKLRALATLPRGALAARGILRQCSAQIVLSLGGYAAAPTVFAAWTLGIPVLGFESNVRPGLVHRKAAGIVRRMLLAWDEAAGDFQTQKTKVTGTPVFSESVRKSADASRLRILVVGGSEGSPFLNRNVPGLLSAVRDKGLKFSVNHQTGFGDPTQVQADYQRHGISADVERFIDDMAGGYARADFVISSAGAVTPAELACHGLPSLITAVGAVAEDHQTANAQAYCRATGALEAPETTWNVPTLAAKLEATLSDRVALTSLGQRARALARPYAAEAIVEECEAVLR